MNNKAQVVGQYRQHVDFSTDLGEGAGAAFWENGTRTEFAPLDSSATGITDQGQIAGVIGMQAYFVADDFWLGGHAVVWDSVGAAPRQLPNLPGHDTSAALAINSVGQVVGATGPNRVENAQPTLWQNNTAIALPLPAGYTKADGVRTFGYATGINKAGQIIGNIKVPKGETFDPTQPDRFFPDRAIYWKTPTQAIDLAPVSGRAGNWASLANAINDAGQVVGRAGMTVNFSGWATYRPTSWVNGVASDLGTLGGTSGEVLSINNLGQAVGTSQDASQAWKMTMWYKGKVIDLSSRLDASANGVNLTRAVAINDKGQILALATSGPVSYYLLTPASDTAK